MSATAEKLGEITVPSGTVVLIDTGLLGMWTRADPPAHGGATVIEMEGVSAIAIAGVPPGATLGVLGERMGEGAYASMWRQVSLEVRPGVDAVRSEAIDTVTVDHARLMFGDLGALHAWQHENSADGLADVVFWGRDVQTVVHEFDARALGDGQFGWLDLDTAAAAARVARIESLKLERALKFAVDFRPHSDHYKILARIRSSPTDSGTIAVGGAQLCGFMTSWGDGNFPVTRELAADGALVRVVVEFATDEALSNLDAVNALSS